MSANLASLVNQQQYHAELLIGRLLELDEQALSYRAEKQALLNASIHALFLSYKGFLQEVAESCQLMIKPESVLDLEQALAEQSRSHAIVANIISMLDPQGREPEQQWLATLLMTEEKLFEAAPKQVQARHQNLISLQNLTAEVDVEQVQFVAQSLKAFVLAQREYLQEW